jgi:hypothetical protein
MNWPMTLCMAAAVLFFIVCAVFGIRQDINNTFTCSASGMEYRTWRGASACVDGKGQMYDPDVLRSLDRGKALLGP